MKYTASVAALAVVLSSSLVSALPAASLDERGLFDLGDLLNYVLPENFTSDLNLYGGPPNDFTCVSDKNPVVLLHGLSANAKTGLNALQQNLTALGWCTFSLTYGAHTLVPWIGGVTAMADSAKEVADLIREVNQKTGKKVDLVGHSEGGVMTIYVPMTQTGISDIVERAVALGPAIYGAQYYGFTNLWYLAGEKSRKFVGHVLDVLGCPACDDLATDGKVYDQFQANNGHIMQPGVKTTILMSRSDKLVPSNTSVVNEQGVRNIYVQDYCTEDKVGHGGLSQDRNVWSIVRNELEEKYDASIAPCSTDHISPF